MIRIEVTGETTNNVVRDLRALVDVLQDNPLQVRSTPRLKTRRQLHAVPDADVLAAVRRIETLGVTGAAESIGRPQAWLSAVLHGRSYRDLQPEIQAIMAKARSRAEQEQE